MGELSPALVDIQTAYLSNVMLLVMCSICHDKSDNVTHAPWMTVCANWTMLVISWNRPAQKLQHPFYFPFELLWRFHMTSSNKKVQARLKHTNKPFSKIITISQRCGKIVIWWWEIVTPLILFSYNASMGVGLLLRNQPPWFNTMQNCFKNSTTVTVTFVQSAWMLTQHLSKSAM